jgi:phage tail-like protein
VVPGGFRFGEQAHIKSGDTKMRRTYLWPVIILCAAALISLSLFDGSRLHGDNGSAAPLSAEPSDSFVFELRFGGEIVAEYTECLGLGSSNQIEEAVIQTDAGGVKQKTPGVLEWHNVTLKRTGVSEEKVWEWRAATVDGHLDEAVKDAALVMFSADSSRPLAQWELHRAWVASLTIEGPREVLTIVHEGVRRVFPSPPNVHR